MVNNKITGNIFYLLNGYSLLYFLKQHLILGLHYVPGSHGSHGSQKRSSPWCF